MEWDTYNTKAIQAKYLYRYVSLEKLISFLKTGSLYLARMDSFEDDLEGIIPYDITELSLHEEDLPSEEERNPAISKKEWKEIEENRLDKLKSIQATLSQRQQQRFVSCWFLGDAESIGMWDLYAPNGFLIRFERKELQDLVKSNIGSQSFATSSKDLLVAGKVRYQNFNDIPYDEENTLIKYSGFRKHIAFKHEEEYRFVLHKRQNEQRSLKFKLGAIEDSNFQLFANPRMKDFTFNTYKDIIERYSKQHQLTISELKLWLEFKNKTF